MEMNNEMNETKTQEEKKRKIKIFIAKLIGYIFLGLVTPIGFLIWRFQLFQQTSKLNIGGWGIVAIIFTAVFLNWLIKQATECIDSTFVQKIFQAIRKVLIPLLTITLCIYAVGEFWKELMVFFIVLTICEPVAYVLNPFPEYLKEKEEEKDDSKQDSKMIKFIELFWDKKK